MNITAFISSQRMSPRATVTGLLSFVLIGASQALYGPALPGFTETFGLPSGAGGLIISVHNAGALLGVLSAIPLAGRPVARWRVGFAVGLLAVGALLVGLSPSWAVALLGALLIGGAYGGLTIGINSLYAAGFGERSPAMVNLLNAVFGLGAILSPLLVLLNPGSPQIAFLVLAGASVLLFPLSLGMDDRVSATSSVDEPGRQRGLLVAFVFLLALGVGVEASTIGYAASYLVATGITASGAATLTSLFFVAYTLARLLAIPLSLRFAPSQLAMGSLVLTFVLLIALHNASLAPLVVVLLGGTIAVFFPNCFNWLSRVFGASAGTVLVLAGALLGGAFVPSVVAWVVGSFGEVYSVSAIAVFGLMALVMGGVILAREP